jgi:magnesium chelatase family protein
MGGSDGACTCDPAAARRYARRVSGPLLDRIDLQVDVPRVPWRDLSRDGPAECSERVRARVAAARDRSARRTGGRSRPNAQLADAELDDVCRLDLRGKEALGRRADRLRLSARACRRVLRVARTVADLDGADRIAAEHVLEAVRYRSLDRVEEV